MPTLQEFVRLFASGDDRMRFDILLDLSERLPPLPTELQQASARAQARVPECQSPVYLWVRVDPEKRIRLYADAPREAPTVRGFVALLVEALDGHPAQEIWSAPIDLLHRLGLAQALGMQRARGLEAIYRRLLAEVKRQLAESDSA
ncbi:MAG: SufE family protein [Bacteroidetes bacterium]|nr:SufE family protein [Rhodothermia bacterium]MCS7155504.1 SufE family protein [Bacteroidota bacterium]MCX7907403.1 SufE family protein [Bacteroidota bacterium]MDW8138397.1 SufE family protein [Bacteroidota bacterium]MDW8284666.1 SufE family protein [Bacteroidota bacterium]